MVKICLSFFVALVLMFSFVGCATTSGSASIKAIDSSKLSQMIKKGKTTKQDVVKMLGESEHKSYSSKGTETWSYMYSETQYDLKDEVKDERIMLVKLEDLIPSAKSGVYKMIHIEFKNNVVVDWMTNNSSY